MKYEKDLIGYHILLESVIRDRGVLPEQVGRGLCSSTQMHYILNGERLPDYLMRNRIMARLGISSEGYEDYVQYDEYERWIQKQKLICLIEEAKWEEARNLFDLIVTSWNPVSAIEKQFLLDMKARFTEQAGASSKELLSIYEEIVGLTVDKEIFDCDSSRIFLSPVEIYYVIKWVSYRVSVSNGTDVREIILKYDRFIDLVEDSALDDIAKAKVLPFADYVLFQGVGKANISWDYRKLWEHTERAIRVLKNTERFYYLKELVEAREKLASTLKYHSDELILEKEVVKILDDFEGKYATDIPMSRSGYIYRDSIIYCIADVIHTRRRMFGISRAELADGVCTVRTLERIEAKHSKPQMYVMQGLFSKLNLIGAYRRAEIITDDVKMIRTFNKYKVFINQKKYEEAFEIIEYLVDKLDKRYIPNRQAIIRMVNVRKRFENGIEKQIYIANLKKAWKLSIDHNLNQASMFFFTEGEKVLLYNIATQEDFNSCYRRFLDCSLYELKNEVLLSHFPIYELVKDWEASMVGNLGEYDDSNDISEKIIRNSFRLKRFHGLYRANYNIYWNNYEAEKKKPHLMYIIKVS
ncbi:hypothetical protein CIY_04130 [Butyrivibrio fibrisolvens 16/4]|nr:hypothetical protein CIY_04130 [Butyrivibrio fibrisolvens 16/4]